MAYRDKRQAQDELDDLTHKFKSMLKDKLELENGLEMI